MKKQLFFKLTCLFFILFASTGYSQNRNITGNITDENGVPLPGVNIVLKGTNIGASSDFDGNFSISVSEGKRLIFSYVGFKSKEILIGNSNSYKVILEDDNAQLDEVIIVGYGSQKKSDLTGAVASIDKNRLEKVPNSNFAQALQGSVAGVSVVNSGGSAEGNEVAIIIRGRNSISAGNGPLIVLDGAVYNGSLSDINPTDIASLEVLKDASSAAIYGSRGANGVILITSKKGVKGQTRISYDGFTGIDEIANLPDLLTPEEFYAFKTIRTPEAISPSEEAIFQSGKGTNWLDEALGGGFRIQHTLALSGGSENTNFYISGSYLDVKGVALNDSYTRGSLRVNVATKVKDWITLATNSQISYGDRSGIPASWSGGTDGAYFLNPLTRFRDDDGNLAVFPWEEERYWANPLQGTLADDKDQTYKLFTNNSIQIDFPFLDGLSYKLNTGIEYEARNRATYFGRDTKIGFSDEGNANTRDNLEKNILLENILNYEKEFGKHKIFATALYSYQNDKIENSRLEATGFGSDVLTYYYNLANVLIPSRNYEERTLLSSMLRLNYTFDDRYAFTFTARRDGYSGFGNENKWGSFPSAAFAWNIDNEEFMADSETINTLRLRLSYGVNGNQAIGAYQTLARYTDFPYLDGATTVQGYIPSALGLSNLGWETTTSFNTGIDYGFFKNRLRGSLNLYQSKTTDLLLNQKISPINGETVITNNIGATQNMGIEFDVMTTIINKNDFKWDVNANISYNKNEIVELYGDDQDDINNKWFIGKPIRVNYAYEFDGVYQQGDDFDNAVLPNSLPGYAKIKDQDGDGMITAESDRTILGQRDPIYTAGLNMTFSYKNLSLNIVSQGAFGMTKLNSLLSDDVYADTQRNTTNKNWWTPDNPTNEYYANDVKANPRGVDIYERADYWRLRDVTLSYSLSKKVAAAIGLNNLSIYFSGRNLLTLTKFKGLDPEFSNDLDIPLSRTYTLGLNLSL